MKNTVKCFVIIAIAAVIGFSMAACKDEPEHDPQKSVTISGIPTEYNGKIGVLTLSSPSSSSIAAYSMITINGSSATFSLLDWDTDEPWGKSGNFSLILLIYENMTAITNKVTLYEGIILSLSITQETTAVQWSQFVATGG